MGQLRKRALSTIDCDAPGLRSFPFPLLLDFKGNRRQFSLGYADRYLRSIILLHNNKISAASQLTGARDVAVPFTPTSALDG